MGAPLSPRAADVTGRALAILAEQWPLPVSTSEIVERIGYEARRSLMAYRMLERLARRGEVEKIEVPDKRARYWRLAAKPVR